MRVSLLPLEGDTVQFLAAAGAAASLLPLLRQSRPPFPGAAALSCPARLSLPARCPSLAPQGQRGPGGARRGRPGSVGNSPATRAWASTSHPRPAACSGEERREGRAALRSGRRREAAQAPACGGGGRCSVRQSGGRWDLLPHKGWEGEPRVGGRINTGEEKGVSPSPHLPPPPPSPPPRRARLELPLSVRAPGASPRPSVVRCGARRLDAGGCCCG